MGVHLENLTDAEDRRRRLEALKSAITASSRSDAASHAVEGAEWERAELTDPS